tara:strand:+ start:312 stop:869 length:558 start_codon:yes stop_codon:yes gene_type:complete
LKEKKFHKKIRISFILILFIGCQNNNSQEFQTNLIDVPDKIDFNYHVRPILSDRCYKCQDTDQASAALVIDLKRRGLLEDTLVIWGGEFGRTNYAQDPSSTERYGRDPRCFTVWMAGGGVKPGFTYGKTDEFGYNIIENPVHVHDFQATILHLMGIDHEQLTFRHQGRRYRLTDVHGKLVKDVLA